MAVESQHQQLLMSMGSGNTTPAATGVYGVETQHQQLLMSVGSGGTTPEDSVFYKKWKHNTSSY